MSSIRIVGLFVATAFVCSILPTYVSGWQSSSDSSGQDYVSNFRDGYGHYQAGDYSDDSSQKGREYRDLPWLLAGQSPHDGRRRTAVTRPVYPKNPGPYPGPGRPGPYPGPGGPGSYPRPDYSGPYTRPDGLRPYSKPDGSGPHPYYPGPYPGPGGPGPYPGPGGPGPYPGPGGPDSYSPSGSPKIQPPLFPAPKPFPPVHPKPYPTVDPKPYPPIDPNLYPPVDPKPYPPVDPKPYPPVDPKPYPPVDPKPYPPVDPKPYPPIDPKFYPPVDPKPYPPVDPKPYPPVDPKPYPPVDPKPYPPVDPKPYPQFDPKPYPPVDPKPYPPVDPKPYPQIDPKPYPPVDPKPYPPVDPKTYPQIDPKPYPPVDPKPYPPVDPKPHPPVDPKPYPPTDPKPYPPVDPKPYPPVDPKPYPPVDPKPYPAKPLLPSSLCDNCRFKNGVGYNPYPKSCQHYVTCQRYDGYKLIPTKMNCPYNLFWSQKLLTCVKPGDTKCEHDYCLSTKAGATAPVYGNCAAYHVCDGFRRTQAIFCCAYGYRYEPSYGYSKPGHQPCVRDASCRDTCAPKKTPIKKEPCRLRPGTDRYKYREFVNGKYILRPCAPGTRFRQKDCGCTGTYEVAPKKGCHPEVFIDFKYGIRDVSGNFVSVGNEWNRVKSVTSSAAKDGFAGKFYNGQLILWRFSNAPLGPPLKITFFFVEKTHKKGGYGGRNEVLVSNGDCGKGPTVSITFDRSSHTVTALVLTKSGYNKYYKPVTVTVKYAPGEYKFVTYHYDGKYLTLTVNSQSSKETKYVAVYGDIAISQCALSIGGVKGATHFYGMLDDFKLFQCVPKPVVPTPYYPSSGNPYPGLDNRGPAPGNRFPLARNQGPGYFPNGKPYDNSPTYPTGAGNAYPTPGEYPLAGSQGPVYTQGEKPFGNRHYRDGNQGQVDTYGNKKVIQPYPTGLQHHQYRK